MRFYVNKNKKLIFKMDFEKFGGIANETIQIKNCEFTDEIEREIEEAMHEIIERWQPFLENVEVDALFAEKRKQIRAFSDYETTLTDLVEGEFSRYE